jgi:polysaccharide export outer membrane protein
MSLVMLLMTTSCVQKKDFVYFQNKKQQTTNILADKVENYIPILKSDDLITIVVSAVDPELAKPFNLLGAASANASNSNSNSGGGNTTQTMGYLIDANGNIDFPILGTIKLAGMDRMKASEFIKDKLKAYLKEPIVNLRVLNYKVTVLGEVARPGVFTISNERITLPEALGLAGDITLGGQRNNVMVIRDIDGKKIETRVDLTSRDLFSSPVYYLTQNDIIYVQPTTNRMKTTAPTRQNASLILTGVLLIVNTINLITRF